MELLAGLLRHGHTVTLVTAGGRRSDLDILPASVPGPRDVHAWPVGSPRRIWNLWAAWVAGLPLQSRYDWQPVMARDLVELARAGEHDVAHVEHLRGAVYGEALEGLLPVLWDSVDCITDLFQQAARHSASRRGRWMARLELGRTHRYEARLVGMFDQTVVTSVRDRAALLALTRGGAPVDGSGDAQGRGWDTRVAVVPIGVDVGFFQPGHAARNPNSLLFSGKLSYHANVTAACHLVDDIMPHVWSERPNTRVVLAGAEPSREVRRLATQHPDHVTLTGYVDDLRPYLQRAALAVAPLVYAVGNQHKVFEAMACATPVIATPIAVRALAAQPGRDVVVAEGAPAFARAILDLLDDPARATAIGAAGRAYVEANHTWERSVMLLEQAYERAIARFQERQRA